MYEVTPWPISWWKRPHETALYDVMKQRACVRTASCEQHSSPWARGPKLGHRYQKGALNWTLIFWYIMCLSTYFHRLDHDLEHSGVCSLQKTWLELVPPFDTKKWSGSRTTGYLNATCDVSLLLHKAVFVATSWLVKMCALCAWLWLLFDGTFCPISLDA